MTAAATAPEPGELAARLGLTPDPEPGMFSAVTHRDARSSAAITLTTGEGEGTGPMRRVAATTVYHHYAGAPLGVVVVTGDGAARHAVLGTDLAAGQRPQIVVAAGRWHGFRFLGDWSLTGATIAPPRYPERAGGGDPRLAAAGEPPAATAGRAPAGAAAPRPSADRVATALRLQPLPREGGLFTQTHADEHSSAILAMLRPGDFSAMHRLAAPEVWHFHGGDPVDMLVLAPDGEWDEVVLGDDVRAGQSPQIVVGAGYWQGASTRGAWSLFGCTMAPPFSWEEFELGDGAALTRRYPSAAAGIERLVRR